MLASVSGHGSYLSKSFFFFFLKEKFILCKTTLPTFGSRLFISSVTRCVSAGPLLCQLEDPVGNESNYLSPCLSNNIDILETSCLKDRINSLHYTFLDVQNEH